MHVAIKKKMMPFSDGGFTLQYDCTEPGCQEGRKFENSGSVQLFNLIEGKAKIEGID
jgi:hypothetical protein